MYSKRWVVNIPGIQLGLASFANCKLRMQLIRFGFKIIKPLYKIIELSEHLLQIKLFLNKLFATEVFYLVPFLRSIDSYGEIKPYIRLLVKLRLGLLYICMLPLFQLVLDFLLIFYLYSSDAVKTQFPFDYYFLILS